MADTSLAWLAAELEDLRQHHLLRGLSDFETAPEPEIVYQGRRFLLLASNNYLGLAADPRVVSAATEAVRRYGASTAASRLVSGSTTLHRELESELAALKGAEAAIVFSSGYLANLGTIGALVGPGDVIFCDRLNHASIVDAAFLSRARLVVYHHADPDHLAALLERHTGRRRLIVTDSVFSMDGDLAPLPALCDLAERWGCMLMVDEAHATGVLGARGAGAVDALGVRGRVPIVMGTLSKALGSVGGFVAGSRRLVDFLRNRARTFMFDTALAPSAVGAAIAALRVARVEEERRARLRQMIALLHDELVDLGYEVLPPDAAILPVLVGDSDAALDLAVALRERGVWAPAIRPPAVPRGTARVRVTLMATHTPAQLERAVSAFAGARRALHWRAGR
ncbi:MAG TPA: 8-amino-7-oxononanoate synthase [Chloroflexota bacterium]|nr:8-amino-7-oxononanoate synthase [Chloroflexota bacterium]